MTDKKWASCTLSVCAILLLPGLATVAAAQKPSPLSAAGGLTVEQVSAEPDLDERDRTLRWSPDGARVAWIEWSHPKAKGQDNAPQGEIWSFPLEPQNPDAPQDSTADRKAVDTASLLVSASTVTAALRGTTASPHHLRDQEVKGNPFLLRDFAWSRDHASLLLVGAQSLAWLDLASGKSRLLVSPQPDQEIADAGLSPDGRTVSFIRDRSLWLVSVSGGSPRVFVRSPHADMFEGEPDWPYRNELHLDRAYWWSPDSTSIAYLETDDRQVDKYTLRSSTGETREIVYPIPGGNLPIPRLFVKRLLGAPPTEIRIPAGDSKAGTPAARATGFYLPRVSWLPDSHRLAFQRLDRFQHTLELFLADSTTGATNMLLTEKDRYWINLADDLRFLKDGERFLWSSERTGFRHLYLYDLSGKQLVQLTQGEWEVTHLDTVDEAHGSVYFTSTETSPLERQLYKVSLSGGATSRITQAPGTHSIHFSPDAMAFADCDSDHATRPYLHLYRTWEPGMPVAIAGLRTEPTGIAETNGSSSRDLTHHDNQPPTPSATLSSPRNVQPAPDALPPLQPVEFFTLRLHLGVEAHAFLIKPPAFDPTKKYPVIIYVAGGPGEQLVRDVWGGAAGLWMQLMAQKGYVIFALDNQGTAGRGHPFEEPIHLRLGAQELTDQRDGLFYLSTLPYVDMSRLGVCGWGYGGFLAVHALLDRPVAFRAGFAGAPVIDWRLYDAVFPERYLDDSVAHADGWDASSALENNSPRFFKSSMMIAQGTEDEFVHMENLLTLQDRLVDQGKSAEILLLPDRGHTIDDAPARQVLFTRMTEFFVKNL